MNVELERVFSANKEQLYDLWTHPQMISQWFGVKVEIEPRVGGLLKIDFAERDLTRGVYKELDPHRKISFTWNSFVKDEPTGETLVTVTFEEIGSGKTRMKLVHSGFITEEARDTHRSGWTHYFNDWEKKLAA